MHSRSTLTSKGQITIPVEIRNALGLKPGDRLSVELSEDRKIMLQPGKKLHELFGMLGPPPNGRSLTIEEMNEAVKDAVCEHVMSAFQPEPSRPSRKKKKK